MTYLNERGQLSIPQAVQETLHWFSGMELTLTLAGNGLLIKPRKTQGKHRLEDLRGFLLSLMNNLMLLRLGSMPSVLNQIKRIKGLTRLVLTNKMR